MERNDSDTNRNSRSRRRISDPSAGLSLTSSADFTGISGPRIILTAFSSAFSVAQLTFARDRPRSHRRDRVAEINRSLGFTRAPGKFKNIRGRQTPGRLKARHIGSASSIQNRDSVVCFELLFPAILIMFYFRIKLYS